MAISACVYGERVRYDGADKAQPELVAGLRDAVELVPLCPEAGAGLGVPRPPVQLTLDGAGQLRMKGRDQPELDVTEAVQAYSEAALDRLLAEGRLCGWIFKSRSPSCGFGSTPHYSADGLALYHRDGLQAALVRQRAPWVVAREETELADARQQREFIALCRLVWSLCHSGETSRDTASAYTGSGPRIARSVEQQHRPLLDLLSGDGSPVQIALESGDARRYCAVLLARLSETAAGDWLDIVEAIVGADFR